MKFYTNCSSSVILDFILDNFFVKTVDDADGKQDTCAGADGAQKIGEDSKGTDADTAQSGSSHNQLFEFLSGTIVGPSLHKHALFFKIVSDFLGALARDFNPGS